MFNSTEQSEEIINNLIQRYNVLRKKFTTKEWKNFLDKIIVVHSSFTNTSIEGTDATLEDTYAVFNGAHLPQDRKLDEEELINYRNALKFIHVYKGQINQEWIKNIHRILLHKVYDSIAGEYRKDSTFDINDTLNLCLLNWFYKILTRSSKVEIFLNAIKFYITFEKIHPFKEGNGRTGRIIFSNIMERIGLPPLVFSIDQGHLYYTAIRKGDNNLLALFFIRCYEQLMELMEDAEEYY